MKNIAWKTGLKRLGLLALAVAVISGGWVGWKVYAAAANATGNNNPLQLLSVFTPTQLKESNGRVNVLVAGYSVNDPGHDGASLTDSIMVLSIDPTTKKAVTISVPRDLWVDIPGFGYQKINAAYYDGGMPLLQQVVEQALGISINYYSLINYTAVKDAVNAVGGISVNIASSDPRGLYDPYTNLQLSNGWHTLDGQTALNLARARGDGPGSYGFSNSDFDRMKNQQLILLALKDKAGSALSNPLKIAGIASALGDNVRTDMNIGEMETLYSVSKGISDANIQNLSLNSIDGQNLLASYTSMDGQEALIPADGMDNYTQIQQTLSQLLV
jgi:LCP family protein required for cell wall assembly